MQNFGGKQQEGALWSMRKNESVDFHNDIIMHLLDFEVGQNLDDTAPKK